MTRQAPSVWWLHPAFPFGAAGMLIGVLAYGIPESMYQTYWRTPKFFGLDGLEVTLAAVAVFTFGTILGAGFIGRLLGVRRGWDLKDSSFQQVLTWKAIGKLFRASFYLCLLGYALWIALAVQRGMTPSVVLGVLSGEKGAIYDARFIYLPTVGGVTTLTQFGSAAMVLGAILGFSRGWRPVWSKLAIVVGLAILRAFVNSERFALIELAVPFFVAGVALRYIGSTRVGWVTRTVMVLAPLLGISAL